MKTTLNKIREKSPCNPSWAKLLKTLGKTKADDDPLSIVTILDSNGIDDALWCLQAVTGHDREIRLFSVWCARQVQHLMTDPRSLVALDVAERFANGEATKAELNAAAGAAATASAATAARAAAYANAAAGAATAARAAAYASATFTSAAATARAADAARATQAEHLRKLCADIELNEASK